MCLTCRPWVFKVPGLHFCYNQGYREIWWSCQFSCNDFGGLPFFLQINTGLVYLQRLQSLIWKLLHCSMFWSFAYITLRVITNEYETGRRTQEPVSLSLRNSLRITFVVLSLGVGTILASVLFELFIKSPRKKRTPRVAPRHQLHRNCADHYSHLCDVKPIITRTSWPALWSVPLVPTYYEATSCWRQLYG